MSNFKFSAEDAASLKSGMETLLTILPMLSAIELKAGQDDFLDGMNNDPELKALMNQVADLTIE